jgi:predicted dehydrogenase
MSSLVHAIIGCGRVAPNHVDGFGQLPNVRVSWACDRDGARAAAFAAEHGIPDATDSVAEVLADRAVQSVSIAVDHAQHAELVGAALNAGKHVLVEKPLALDYREGHDLVAHAEQAGLVLSVVSQHRYDPLVVAIGSWVRDGLLGDVVSASVNLQCGRTASYYGDSYWRGTWAGEGGSALVNQGYHALDVVRWLCDDLEVLGSAIGRTAPRGQMETEDTLAALLRSPRGVLVTYSVTVASAITWRTRISLVGTGGSVLFDLDHPGTIHHVAGGPDLLHAVDLERTRSECEEPTGIDYYGVSHRRQIADFCATVAGGKSMVADGRAGLDTLQLIGDLYRMAGAPAAACRAAEPKGSAGG